MSATGVLARQVAQANGLAQAQVGAATVAALNQLLVDYLAGRISFEQFVNLWVALEQAGFERTARDMAQFMESYRSLQGATGLPAARPAVFDAAYSLGRAVTAGKQLTLARETAGLADRTRTYWAQSGFRTTLAGGRRTVEQSTAAAHTSWRRVTGARPCAFCAMLSTRDDYRSFQSATTVRRKRKRLGEAYHDHCNCTAVEVVGDWEPTELDQALQDLYYECSGGDTKEILARMRAQGGTLLGDSVVPDGERRKPGRPKGSVNGGGVKPPKPPHVTGGDNQFRSFQDWREHCLDDATDAEKDALRKWTTDWHRELQQQLRTGLLDPENREMVSLMDQALSRHPLPEDTILHRRDSLAWLGITDLQNPEQIQSLFGKTYDLPGFFALSTKKSGVRVDRDASVRVHVHVHAGTPAADLQSVSVKPEQREILVVQGRIFAVEDVEIINDYLHVTGRLV